MRLVVMISPLLPRMLFLLALAFVLSPGIGHAEDSSAPPRELRLLCWTEYVPENVITGFEQKAGVKVLTANYNSNEQMLAMLKAKPGYYDLVQPSQAYVTALIHDHDLAAIDRDRIPNWRMISWPLRG